MRDLLLTLESARAVDAVDELASFRGRFHHPGDGDQPWRYFCGNSLGLQPKTTREALDEELEVWARLAVEGHFEARLPWYSYDEPLRAPMARVVGALPHEVAIMGSLTTNLHLLMVSFYRPTAERHRIVIEAGAFPSDRYAVSSQALAHGYDPESAIVELAPRPDEDLIRVEDIEAYLENDGHQVALVMLGGVSYYTGQAFEIGRITRAAHRAGARVGFDLAHAAGNIDLALHDDGPDFAAWCTYKYLNSGPGAVGGLFVHERHEANHDLARFAGWWGNDPDTRFDMAHAFTPRRGAGGWQLSNAPIMSMAPLRASLAIFEEATMSGLRRKSLRLTGFLERLLDEIDGVEIITPREEHRRGAQLSVRIERQIGGPEPVAKVLHGQLRERGVIVDFRTPDVLRLAPVPLYNSFEDVWEFAQTLRELIASI